MFGWWWAGMEVLESCRWTAGRSKSFSVNSVVMLSRRPRSTVLEDAPA